MKVVCFNINSIRARLHQVEAIIEKHQPDVIGLQETKVHDEEFPHEAIEAMGYKAYAHGQKGHYGVCLLSKVEPISVQKGFLTDDEDAQRRMIMADFATASGTVTLLNGYFPQGENISHETKFPAKEKFYADLNHHLENHCDPKAKVIVMGDLNISPTDADIGIGEPNRKRWLKTGKTSFQPIEREWLATLQNWGLDDSFRVQNPDVDDRFSWFDYRSKGFEAEPKRGLRIDAILTTAALTSALKDTGIDYELRGMEKPSDHAPIWAEFEL